MGEHGMFTPASYLVGGQISHRQAQKIFEWRPKVFMFLVATFGGSEHRELLTRWCSSGPNPGSRSSPRGAPAAADARVDAEGNAPLKPGHGPTSVRALPP